MWPAIQELLTLAVGVHIYNTDSGQFFALYTFLILVFGNIPVISMVLQIKATMGSALIACAVSKVFVYLILAKQCTMSY